MKTSVAQVRQVLTGHSDRALVTAVDGSGHEYKLEIPVGDARDVTARMVLVLTWSFHPPMEEAAPASTTSIDPVSRADDEFRAMMPGAATPAQAPERSVAQRLAEQLGLGGAR